MSVSDQQLRSAMREAENAAAKAPTEQLFTDVPQLGVAVYAALGSKYLAVGAPATLGIVDCGEAASLIVRCHQLLFGELQIRCAGKNSDELGTPISQDSCSTEHAFACDIVCINSSQNLFTDWIAEATHINIHAHTDSWSSDVQALCAIASVTMQTGFRDTPPSGQTDGLLSDGFSHGIVSDGPLSQGTPLHGTLSQVITGHVSGRSGEELTILTTSLLTQT